MGRGGGGGRRPRFLPPLSFHFYRAPPPPPPPQLLPHISPVLMCLLIFVVNRIFFLHFLPLLTFGTCISERLKQNFSTFAELTKNVQDCVQTQRVRNFLKYFWGDFFFVLYSTLPHLPPLRFHCADGCWDRTQDRCTIQKLTKNVFAHKSADNR